MTEFRKTCEKHNLPLVEFCNKKHLTMDAGEYQNLNYTEFDNLHEKYGYNVGMLNWDEGAKCEKGCIYTKTVILSKTIKEV